MSDTTAQPDELKPLRPLSFIVAKWQGYILAAMYLLYGGVKMIFGWMDNDFNNFWFFAIWLGYGGLMIQLVLAYRNLKIWGWYGLILFNSIAAIWCFATLSRDGSLALLVLFAVGLVALLWPSTRHEVLGH